MRFPNRAARAKRIIYLFQSGAPSQMDLFDPKPQMDKHRGEDLPASIRMGQRLTTMTSGQKSFPVAPSLFKFGQHGKSGIWLSELMPRIAGVADELCFIRSMNTEAINHDPAITFLQTGSQISGRPSIGAWTHYGLGSDNDNLPAFVVLITRGKGDQPLYSRLWGSGWLPSRFQGVQFRSGKEPVLYLDNPPGVDQSRRREMLDSLRELHEVARDDLGDPELDARVAQYEMAYRMQMSVPEAVDLSGEPAHILEMYGPDASKPGTFAANCLKVWRCWSVRTMTLRPSIRSACSMTPPSSTGSRATRLRVPCEQKASPSTPQATCTRRRRNCAGSPSTCASRATVIMGLLKEDSHEFAPVDQVDPDGSVAPVRRSTAARGSSLVRGRIR